MQENASVTLRAFRRLFLRQKPPAQKTKFTAQTKGKTANRGKNMIKPGKYRHFKGKEYEVIGVAKHSETLEEMVVYRQLYGEHGLWIRPASMWEETVERDGKTYKRFTYIGE